MTKTTKTRRMARPASTAVGENGGTQAGEAPAIEDAAADIRSTKQSLVLDLLRQDSGVALATLAEATGWLPHTTRAALTGLRKKGHTIVRSKVGDETRYALAAGSVE